MSFLHLLRSTAVARVAGWLLIAGLSGGPAQVGAAQPTTQAAAVDRAGLRAAAANAPADLPVSAAEQLKVMQQQVEAARSEARRQQMQLAQVREQLAAAETGNAWLPWLLLVLVSAGALVVWLGLRVRRLRRELAQARWTLEADGLQPPPTGPHGALRLSPEAPLLSRPVDPMPGPQVTAPDMAIATSAAVPAPAPPPPVVLPVAGELSFGTGVPPRPVSVEELLDLDQQVEFFLVLGQTTSAIDLLLSHVRSTGGTYALPYFKLLEIYRLQGDDEAYERTRERFNQRFNAVAPDLSGDMTQGRTLEDYPEVVQRLQRAWAHPLRATAELESMLLRRADLEPFDLPAYREILLLHGLVRDLPAGALHAATTTVPKAAWAEAPAPLIAAPAASAAHDAGVDLLLPLGEALPRRPVAPAPMSERSSAQAMLADWVFTRAVQPAPPPDRDLDLELDLDLEVDIDLSDFAPAPREFTLPAVFSDIDQRRDARLSDLGALDAAQGLPPVSRR